MLMNLLLEKLFDEDPANLTDQGYLDSLSARDKEDLKKGLSIVRLVKQVIVGLGAVVAFCFYLNALRHLWDWFLLAINQTNFKIHGFIIWALAVALTYGLYYASKKGKWQSIFDIPTVSPFGCLIGRVAIAVVWWLAFKALHEIPLMNGYIP